MNMKTEDSIPLHLTRRHFFARGARGIGTAALASLLGSSHSASAEVPSLPKGLRVLHRSPRAKRVIYLFMSGGPSQLETFDYKPELVKRTGEDLPASVRMGQRLTGMSAQQATLPIWMLEELIRPRQRPVTNVVAIVVFALVVFCVVVARRRRAISLAVPCCARCGWR